MWKKEVTDELKKLAQEYKQHFGIFADGYDELIYDAMTYDEFVKYIKKSLATGKELPYIVP